MAKKFLTGLKLVNLPSDPASGEEGELYFNTSASVAKIYKQGAWSELTGGAGGGSTITVSTTAPVSPEIGDEWYKNDTGELFIWDGTYWVEVNGTISITQEQVQDYVAPMFTSASGTNVVAIYDDVNNVINLNTSGSLISVDSIVYPDYITFDTTPETSSAATGTMFWDSGDGLLKTTLNANVELGIGQESVALVKNTTGSTIAKGKVVYINGAYGQRPTIALSDADTEVTSSKTFGFTAEEILDEAEGFVVTEGILRGVDTDGLTEGGAVWLSSTAGGFTQTMPTQPSHGVFLGYVVKANPSSGEIFVKIQNGYELQELHNVLITSASVQQALVYDSDGLWKNQYIVNSVNGTGDQIEINNETGTGDIVLSLPNELITPGNLTVTGNLTVSGSTTYINTETLNIEDNIITLNSNVTGSPTGTAGIEVERGTETNSYVLWDESLQAWNFSNDIRTFAVRSNNSLQLDVSASVGYSGEIDLTTAFAELNINTDGSIDLRPGDISGFEMYKFTKSYLQFPDLSQQDTAFLGMSAYYTDNLPEGITNLYFTDERAQDAIGNNVGAGLSYNDGTGAISNSGVTSLTGTANEISISSSTGDITIGIPDSPTLSGDLTVLSASPKIYLDNGTNSLKIRAAGSLTGNVSFDIPVTGGVALVTSNIGSSVQAYDADLSAIAALTGTSGILTTNGSGTWSVITDGSSNWNTAYGWGDHASAGYLTEETDPIFVVSEAYTISSTDTGNWNTAYGWGNHASAGYLTSYTETDTLETVTDRGATSSNAITISNTTPSTSTTTGALVVSGGLGVGDSVWIDGDLHVNGTTSTLYSSTVATQDNLIYLNQAQDATITNAVYSSGSITYTADNSYTVGMDIRITGVDPAGFNISSGDGLVIGAATSTEFVVVKSDPGASYVSGGTAHAKTEANADLGFAGGYYNAGYAHAGLFRDASDGIFKFFDGYTPEPDEAVNIDTTHVSFALADVLTGSLTASGSFTVSDILSISSSTTTDISALGNDLVITAGSSQQAILNLSESGIEVSYQVGGNNTLLINASAMYLGPIAYVDTSGNFVGTWQGGTIDPTYGGTGLFSYTTGDILYASATNTLSKLAATTDGYVLTLASGVPTWAAATGGGGGGLSTTTTSITTNSATAIESFAIATSRTAEAIIQVTQGTDYYSSKVLLIHDGTTVKITEYAILESTVGAIPLTISAAISGSNLELLATITDAATTSATAKVVLIEVAV